MNVNDPFESRASGRLPDNATIEDMLALLDEDRGLSRPLSGYSFGLTLTQANVGPTQKPLTPVISAPTVPTVPTIPTVPTVPTVPTTTTAPRVPTVPTTPTLAPRVPTNTQIIRIPTSTASDIPTTPLILPTSTSTTTKEPPPQQPSISINVTGGSSTGGGGGSSPAGPGGGSSPASPDVTPKQEPGVVQESKPFPWIWVALGAAALWFFTKKTT